MTFDVLFIVGSTATQYIIDYIYDTPQTLRLVRLLGYSRIICNFGTGLIPGPKLIVRNLLYELWSSYLEINALFVKMSKHILKYCDDYSIPPVNVLRNCHITLRFIFYIK